MSLDNFKQLDSPYNSFATYTSNSTAENKIYLIITQKYNKCKIFLKNNKHLYLIKLYGIKIFNVV